MDSIWVVLIPLPFAKPGPFYKIDPEADVLIIVPPREQQFASWSGSDSDLDESDDDRDTLSKSGLRIQVSSKHLILASEIFKKKLRHFSRNTSVRPDGRIHLNVAQGFDARAAAIVLNAVHGKASKTPKRVDLETLAQIALFAHKFQLVEAVSPYAAQWISKLQGRIPDTYNRELVLWIYISHVFGDGETFKAATKVAAVHSPGRLNDLGLPLAKQIIDDIDGQRQELIDEALTTVYDVLDNLSNGSTACSEFHCDSLLLGELVKTLNKHGLLWPRAAKPFLGVSHSNLIHSLGPLAKYRRRIHEQENVSAGAQEPYVINGAGNKATKNVSKAKYVNGTNGTNGVNGTNGTYETAKKVNGSAGKLHPAVALQNGDDVGIHDCHATRLMASLGQLSGLAGRVTGLEGEDSVGNWIY